jgi:hypothetical protein
MQPSNELFLRQAETQVYSSPNFRSLGGETPYCEEDEEGLSSSDWVKLAWIQVQGTRYGKTWCLTFNRVVKAKKRHLKIVAIYVLDTAITLEKTQIGSDQSWL